jgi:hypothetical protein
VLLCDRKKFRPVNTLCKAKKDAGCPAAAGLWGLQPSCGEPIGVSQQRAAAGTRHPVPTDIVHLAASQPICINHDLLLRLQHPIRRQILLTNTNGHGLERPSLNMPFLPTADRFTTSRHQKCKKKHALPKCNPAIFDKYPVRSRACY